MNPAHNNIDLFQKAEQAGYDGISIWDFAQSKQYGNVGHESIGIFPAGLAKLYTFAIPAVGHDLADDVTVPWTPEFAALKASLENEHELLPAL